MMYFLATIFLLGSILKNIKVLLSSRGMILTKDYFRSKPLENFYIHILIPVYDEESVIQETHEHYQSLGLSSDRVQVSFIQSAKELKKPISHRTLSHVEKKDSKFRYIQCPWYGSKATQLNYYFQEYTNKNDWILVFDVDSRVEVHSMQKLLLLIPKLSQKSIYQLPSNYLKGNSFNFWQLVFAIQQTTFSLEEEIFNSIDGFWCNKLKYQSIIGHGLLLNKQIYDKIKGFPDPVEDTRLAFEAIKYNISIAYLPWFDNGTVARNLTEYVNQTSGWFYGQSFIVKDIILAWRSLTVFQKSKCLHRIWLNMWWVGKSYFILGLTLYGLIAQNYGLIFMLYTTLVINHISDISTYYILYGRIRLSMMLYGVVGDLVYSLGPTLFFIKFMRSNFNKEISLLPKTPKS